MHIGTQEIDPAVILDDVCSCCHDMACPHLKQQERNVLINNDSARISDIILYRLYIQL